MSPAVVAAAVPRLDPPLDPSGDEARSRVRRELLRPEYHDQNVVQRVLDWVARQVDEALAEASRAPALSTLMSMVVFAVLALALAWLVSRARRTVGRREPQPVLGDEVVTAEELRARAEAAFAAGRFEEAVVDGFRTVAVRQVERGRLADTPGTTAHEVAESLAAEYAAAADRLRAGARLFDQVLYGDRPATREQARSVLALDDELVVRR